jgi:hypothetical protein
MRAGNLLPSPSMAVAMTAMVLALTGGAYAASDAMSTRVGHTAKSKHSTPKPLTKNQVVKLINQQLSKRHVGPGPTGLSGASGQTGKQGPSGETGPAGPGAKLLTFNSTTPEAAASPTPTPIGSMGPYSIGASCSTNAGTLTVGFWIQGPSATLDGSHIDQVDGGTPTPFPVSSVIPSTATLTPIAATGLVQLMSRWTPTCSHSSPQRSRFT